MPLQYCEIWTVFSTEKKGLKETADKIKPRTNEQVIDCFEKSIIGEKHDDAENEKLNYIFVSSGGGGSLCK